VQRKYKGLGENNIMQHLAIIPDGNRRWAANHKLAAHLGHHKGMKAFQTAIKVCINNGIKYLSFYTFSLENFNRSENEKKYLFSELPSEFLKKLPDLIKNGVKVQFFGDEAFFPAQLRPTINDIQKKTQDLGRLNLNLLFCYGGRQELVFAARKLAQQVVVGQLSVDEISEHHIRNELWTSSMPDPDLIIRTSGIVRLSNFLLFQAAYSEFKFLNCFWPEVSEQILQNCIDEFDKVTRNFGK
jgi:undecaprenyl diphosphate synthase